MSLCKILTEVEELQARVRVLEKSLENICRVVSSDCFHLSPAEFIKRSLDLDLSFEMVFAIVYCQRYSSDIYIDYAYNRDLNSIFFKKNCDLSKESESGADLPAGGSEYMFLCDCLTDVEKLQARILVLEESLENIRKVVFSKSLENICKFIFSDCLTLSPVEFRQKFQDLDVSSEIVSAIYSCHFYSSNLRINYMYNRRLDSICSEKGLDSICSKKNCDLLKRRNEIRC